MSRRVFVGGVAIVLVALAFVVTDYLLGLAPAPTEANAKRIRPGMNMHEAEAILGGPGELQWMIGSGYSATSAYRWTGPGGSVVVRCEQSTIDWGVAAVIDLRFERLAERNLLERLSAWFGR